MRKKLFYTILEVIVLLLDMYLAMRFYIAYLHFDDDGMFIYGFALGVYTCCIILIEFTAIHLTLIWNNGEEKEK